MPIPSAAERRALLAIHQGHTPAEAAACDACRRVRRALALALHYTLDDHFPEDR